MSTTVIKPQTPFWKGTNFYLALLMFVGSFFAAPGDLATTVVMSIVGLVAAVGAVRQFLPSAKFVGWRSVLASANTWNYLTGLLTLVGIPAAGEIIPALQGLTDALVDGNWGLVITRGVALLTILFYLLKNKNTAGGA